MYEGKESYVDEKVEKGGLKYKWGGRAKKGQSGELEAGLRFQRRESSDK